MPTWEYIDLDLLIERAPSGYRARVIDSPVGQAIHDFTLPFSDLEIENFLLRIGVARRAFRRLETQEMAASKSFGARLFDAVFGGDIRGCLRSSIDEANRQRSGLRIRLRLSDVPELADLPWEFLYNSSINRFLSLSVETPLVRYLELPERVQPLMVTLPLRVLVMISSPTRYPPLDVDREWSKLKEALAPLETRGLVALERQPDGTLTTLQRRLRQQTFHVFHFIGHGGFDAQSQDGVLALEDELKKDRLVTGQDLGTLLHDHRSLRLVVLNACEGARASRTDPFAGTAQSLLQQGIPAVIAMQFEISDEAAITLAREFYGALTDGYPADAALGEARKAIYATGNETEWATPVMYLRSEDAKIFNIAPIAHVTPTPIPDAAAPPASVTRLHARVPETHRTMPPFKSTWPAWLLPLGGAAALVFILLCLGGGFLAKSYWIDQPFQATVTSLASQLVPTKPALTAPEAIPARSSTALPAASPTASPAVSPTALATTTATALPASPTATVPAPTITPTQVIACVPAPILFDPPDLREFYAKNAVLRWRSDYELKPGEVFDVLVWPDGAKTQPSIGATTDKMIPIDFNAWPYGPTPAKFFWTVRIKMPTGSYLSCPSQPFAFTLTGAPPPPPKVGTGSVFLIDSPTGLEVMATSGLLGVGMLLGLMLLSEKPVSFFDHRKKP